MGGDKQLGSKRGGSYVGGFLQLFDWNAKSRKKLFASKSDLPEQSKQKKRTEGNLPTTRFYVDEAATGYSIKGSEYSCASSMTDEDGYGSKAPSVVARLMGLDSLPFTFNDTSSLGRDIEYQREKLDDLVMLHQKAINKPIEKFQSEILPPRSAKSIPITHHKLLSPIKRPGFVPSYKDASQIMEAASKIIEPSLLQSNARKAKLPSLGTSPSVPLKTKDLKDKASSSKTLAESNNMPKFLKGQASNKADSDDCTDVKKKAKTISLALQAKVNVQRREGLNQITSKNAFGQKDQSNNNTNSNRTLKSQPNNSQKKPCGNNSSSVLRQNNQKQNCPTDNRENHSASKPSLSKSQGRRTLQGDSSLRRDKTQNNRPSGNSKIGTRKFDQDSGSNGKQDVLFSTTKTVPRKKRLIEKNETPVPSDSLIDRQNGDDIVSFTFTTPMTRSGKNESFQRQTMALEKSEDFITEHNDNRGKKMNLLEYNNVIGGDALSALLEQKLRELTNGSESSTSSCSKAGSNSFTASVSKDSVNMKTFSEISSTDPELRDRAKMDPLSRNTKQFLPRFSSPISVFDHSSESADSNSIESSNRLCSSSSVQAQQVVGIKTFKFSSMETNTDLSDSACSTSTIVTMNQELGLFTTNEWELEYLKEILSDVELMFDDYALGISEEMMNPQVFDRVESQIDASGSIIHKGETFKLKRNVLFDCASESMELRCRNYVAGGWKAFGKGMLAIKRKDRLAEEINKEISIWGEMGGGDTMVDDLVDRDMSSQYGKWLDFDIEGFEIGVEIQDQILHTLMEEVMDDIWRL